MNTTPTVFVIDDDGAVCDSLRALIEADGLAVETFSRGDLFLDGFDPTRCGCIVLDLSLPGLSGLEVLNRLRSFDVRPPVICVTGNTSVVDAVRAMRCGAMDLIEKPFGGPGMLIARIRTALEADVATHDARARQAQSAQLLKKLTPREREVVTLVVDGKSTKDIAGQLHRSPKTIDKHRLAIMDKLGARNAAELTRIVMEGRAAER